jgi:hypothetical protein
VTAVIRSTENSSLQSVYTSRSKLSALRLLYETKQALLEDRECSGVRQSFGCERAGCPSGKPLMPQESFNTAGSGKKIP